MVSHLPREYNSDADLRTRLVHQTGPWSKVNSLRSGSDDGIVLTYSDAGKSFSDGRYTAGWILLVVGRHEFQEFGDVWCVEEHLDKFTTVVESRFFLNDCSSIQIAELHALFQAYFAAIEYG